MAHKNYKRGFGPLAIIIVIAIVAAIGGGAYYSTKKAAAPKGDVEAQADADASANANANANADANVNAGGTLRDIIGMAKDVMCTFSSSDANGESSGTVYVSGTSMRGDFAFKSAAGASTESHMIRQGDSALFWSGSEGMKMKMSDAMVSSKTTTQSNTNVDMDKKVDYKCSPWKRDSGKLTAPTSVKFVDIGAMMQGAAGVNTGGVAY